MNKITQCVLLLCSLAGLSSAASASTYTFYAPVAGGHYQGTMVGILIPPTQAANYCTFAGYDSLVSVSTVMDSPSYLGTYSSSTNSWNAYLNYNTVPVASAITCRNSPTPVKYSNPTKTFDGVALPVAFMGSSIPNTVELCNERNKSWAYQEGFESKNIAFGYYAVFNLSTDSWEVKHKAYQSSGTVQIVTSYSCQ